MICIANDDGSPKVRSLQNYCLKLKFRRPMASQCRERVLKIAKAEGFEMMNTQTAERLAESCHGDFRQIINHLQSWRVCSKTLSFSDVIERTKTEGKSFENQSIFELFRTLFDGNRKPLFDQVDTFCMDADLVPLFAKENYLSFNSAANNLDVACAAADSISEGDIAGTYVRSLGRWDLMPTQAVLSSIRPASMAQGFLQGRPNFLAWLGKNSAARKNERLVRELEMRMKSKISGNFRDVSLDYSQHMRKILSKPLEHNGKDGIEEVIDVLDSYYLSKDDFDSVMSLAADKAPQPDALSKDVKTAFTRTYNSTSHHMSSVSAAKVSTKVGRAGEASEVKADDIEEEEAEVESDDEDSSKEETNGDGLIVKPGGKKASKSSAGGTKPTTKANATKAKKAPQAAAKKTGRKGAL
mmetsp:Transcript_8142/g.21332  ORF Transcript_8142/g.21332 Transcript_8142/m.21332 type:complete len:412 (-) Transcript_8142:66-1301(-)